jgi:hypothetical protein
MTIPSVEIQFGVVDRGEPAGAIDVVILRGHEPVAYEFPAQAEGQVFGEEAVRGMGTPVRASSNAAAVSRPSRSSTLKKKES